MDRATVIVVLAVLAPVPLLGITAMLRGYTITITFERGRIRYSRRDSEDG